MSLAAILRKVSSQLLSKVPLRRCLLNVAARSASCGTPSGLKEVLSDRICKLRKQVSELRERQGSHVVDDITIQKLFGGLRNTTGLICETSALSEKGLLIHGMELKDVCQKLPKIRKQPMPEGLFWFLLTGDMPSKSDADRLGVEWANRAKVGNQQLIIDNIKYFSNKLHPLAQLACVYCGLSEFSKVTADYKKKPCSNMDWELVYEDCMDVIALAPVIAARIYNCQSNKKGEDFNDTLDWTSNYVRMLGLPCKKLENFLRLLITVQADHACGNPGTHSSLITSSTLSNPYLAYASGVIAMTGPKHALTSQMYAEWLAKVLRCVGYKACDAKILEYLDNYLEDKFYIPGFEHPILRGADPRYGILCEYAHKPVVKHKWLQFSQKVSALVPQVLAGKSCDEKCAFPTVHVLSAPLLHVYDITETSYYPVIFAMSRSLGICAQVIMASALELPLEYLNCIGSASFSKQQVCSS